MCSYYGILLGTPYTRCYVCGCSTRSLRLILCGVWLSRWLPLTTAVTLTCSLFVWFPVSYLCLESWLLGSLGIHSLLYWLRVSTWFIGTFSLFLSLGSNTLTRPLTPLLSLGSYTSSRPLTSLWLYTSRRLLLLLVTEGFTLH